MLVVDVVTVVAVAVVDVTDDENELSNAAPPSPASFPSASSFCVVSLPPRPSSTRTKFDDATLSVFGRAYTGLCHGHRFDENKIITIHTYQFLGFLLFVTPTDQNDGRSDAKGTNIVERMSVLQKQAILMLLVSKLSEVRLKG